MPQKSPRVFLDTSVIIAAVMSASGGARLLFRMGQAGLVQLMAGKGVLQEAEEVMRRKAPEQIGVLAQLLDEARTEISAIPTPKQQKQAQSLLAYLPDADILAQAIAANPDWFVSHDQEHFLNNQSLTNLPFRIGTPGDALAWLRENME